MNLKAMENRNKAQTFIGGVSEFGNTLGLLSPSKKTSMARKSV